MTEDIWMKLHEAWNINEERIASAAKTIADRRAALKWLEDYGMQLDGRNEHAGVLVILDLGRSAPGASEAAKLLTSYARLKLPEVVKDAIACCTNDINMAIETIRAEIKMGVP